MNIRKLFLIIGCLMSGIGLFLPLYSLQVNGQTITDGNVILIRSFYGIVILLADLVVIISALVGLKKGYVIASLVSVGATAYSVFNASIGQFSADMIMKTTGGLMSSMGAIDYSYSIEEGPAYVLLILAAVVILLTMIWNALNNEN